jgi:hypothetical protein
MVTNPKRSTTVVPFCPVEVDHFTVVPGEALKICVLRGVTSVLARFVT